MLWTDRSLFEYWVHIVPTADYRRASRDDAPVPGGPRGELASRRRIKEWLASNGGFRRYVLRELRRRRPLRARDLEDRTQVAVAAGTDGTTTIRATCRCCWT